ncbi:hypothetical protein E4V91_00590 [Neisseria meningitidis]|nr:hypothetical protein [Neisseria meningitidis]
MLLQRSQSLPSFPRKWESRNAKLQEFIGNDRNSKAGSLVYAFKISSNFKSTFSASNLSLAIA